MVSPTKDQPGSTLGQFDNQTRDYDSECVKMEDFIAALEADLKTVKGKHLAGLKRQAGVVARREAELHSAIESSGGLFVKPRTITLNGIKIGLTASVGSITWDDDAQVVALIRKLRPEEIATLIRSKEEPNKNALKSLEEADLKKLGCRIEDAGDVVVLKRVAGDIEKLVTKLIEKLVAAMTTEGQA